MVTFFSTLSGSEAGTFVTTETTGKSILGVRSTPRPRSDTRPKTIIAAMNIAVNTGRRMAMAEMNMLAGFLDWTHSELGWLVYWFTGSLVDWLSG
jgi:hypothetical protein